MTGINLLPTALKELGVRSLLHYGAYALGLRSGWIKRRTAEYRWEDRPLTTWLSGEVTQDQVLRGREPFFFDPWGDLSTSLSVWAEGGDRPVLSEAQAILNGEFRPFGGDRQRLGLPPPWYEPLHGIYDAQTQALPEDRHWTEYSLEGPTDFKLVWELSRLGWIYPLARAYRLSGEGRYWETAGRLLSSWLEANPPNRGPQWISAQEVAIRLLAMIFAWHAFAPELEQDQRLAKPLLTAIATHATRIPSTLSYAKAQRNNHLLIEAVALYSTGLLFPGLRGAGRWKSLGRKMLLDGLSDQVFPDGGYIQHSVNYHRMALQAGLWACRLAQIHAEILPPKSLQALKRMASCLYAMVDPRTGLAPNFGHNDGTQILPLSSCAYGDQRPTLQAAAHLFDSLPHYPSGPWDEFAFWLGLRPRPGVSERQEPRSESENLPHAGLYFLRADDTWAMLRCVRFRSRPAHSDQLHLDLWRRGRNVILDPGTYRYSAPAPWDQALSGSAAHNGVMLDGLEPMRRAGRFLWLDWTPGELLGRWRSAEGDLELIAARHAGYRRLGVTLLRTVLRAGSDLWLVVDDVLGPGTHRVSSAWTLPDWEWTLDTGTVTVQGPDGEVKLEVMSKETQVGIIHAGELLAGEPPSRPYATLGWHSPTYNELRPALCLLVRTEGRLPLRTLTWFSFGAASPPEAEIVWGSPERGTPAVSMVVWQGRRLQV